MFKKIISAALSAALLLGAAGSTAGAANAAAAAKGARVTLIVETEGAPLLQAENAVRLGAAEFMKTDEAGEISARLRSAQEQVKASIEELVGADANSGFTYTSVVNGFSMEAYESDIEKIKSVDGVKNVYISQTVKIPDEPETKLMEIEGEPGFGAQMMNAQAMYEAGYDGRGQVIAVIDADFDTAHEFFSSPVTNPKLSKNDIREFIENNELNVDVEVNQVYKNSKIPFAYDYADKDADTFNPENQHGSHIAGIAAGKNGVLGGTTFSGVAPEAQLVLMRAVDAEGDVSFNTVIAAMDDASKMDICAVNMSFGATYITIPLFEEAINNMRNAGIAISAPVGNAGRAFETTDNPDYTYYDLPSSYSSSTSVASIDANREWTFGGEITLGNDEKLSTTVYDKNFFEKFSDKFYDYVFITSEFDFATIDVNGKIVVTMSNRGISSGEFLNHGAIGIIVISNDEADREAITESDEIPGIIVRKSYGEKFANSEPKTLKTNANAIPQAKSVPNAGISHFSSWGTGAPLELKPEITAPGGNILSSVNNDQYEIRSGSSMAAPQITGAIALLSGLVGEKFPNVTGPEKVSLMENMLMSSARIIFQDKTLPESPRRQGAGLADLQAAMNLPVILKGDSGKSKLSLKDMLTDNIPIEFTAKNLTNTDVVYDDITLYVFTDNYEDAHDINMIINSTPLTFTSDAPKSVTIPANEEKEITINIELSSDETERNLEVFTNGFWIDGFVVLSSKDGSVTKASMPFTGFYGDWTAQNAMTPSYFEEGGSSENGGLVLRDPESGEFTMLGTNKFLDDTDDSTGYESEDYVGLSPNNTGNYYVRLRMLRSLVGVELAVVDSSGEIIIEEPYAHGLTRQSSERGFFDTLSLLSPTLPEGDYSFIINGRLAYDSEWSRTEEKTYRFYIDSTAPQLRNPSIYEENGEKFASFEASDNRYLMGVEAGDDDGGYISMPIKAEKDTKIVLNITGMDEESLEFTVYDYAHNEISFKIGMVSAQIVDTMKEGDSAALIADVTNTEAEAEADVVMALYSADGRLVGLQRQNVLLESGEKEPLAFSFTGVENAVTAELFVWNHGKMTPLCEAAIDTDL